MSGCGSTSRTPSSTTAAERAITQVQAVRDDPLARLELCARTYNAPMGGSPAHLPFRRAALSFMKWQVNRGVLASLHTDVPGSPWWRAVNERLLRDGCEVVARSAGLRGPSSSRTIELWLRFAEHPGARSWYTAHNASIVAAYLEHGDLAEQEGSVERFFMNVVLLRVLYAHALVAAPQLSLGRFAPLGRLLGDPRLGMAGAFLSLSRVLPARYPADDDLGAYVKVENNVGRLIDYGVILPRLQRLYEWSAAELGEPLLANLASNGVPSYVSPDEAAPIWRPTPGSMPVRLLRRITRARPV